MVVISTNHMGKIWFSRLVYTSPAVVAQYWAGVVFIEVCIESYTYMYYMPLPRPNKTKVS